MIKIPNNCPSCGSTLIRKKDQLYCLENCQTDQRVVDFCKKVGIKGLGIKSCEKLDVTDYKDLFNLTETEFENILGKNGLKIYSQIQTLKTNKIDLGTFLSAMSIPLIGKAIGEKVNLTSSLTFGELRRVGIGEKASNNILNWLENNSIPNFVTINQINESSINQLGTVCISGKLTSYKNKSEAKSILEANGYRVVDSISKKVDYLINESGIESSKTKKANQYDIPVITDIAIILNKRDNFGEK